MKVAIVGSRSIKAVDIAAYLPEGVTEIISGGAVGVDTLAAEYATAHGIALTVIRPDYARYGRAATHIRNREIVERADRVLAFWDGVSRGTMSSVNQARRLGRPVEIIKI